jgi:hypothetical protein
MKSRNEAPSLFAQFKAAAENHCRKKITTLRVDNTPELVQGQMNTYCKAHGIAYEKTVPDSPPQNGIAERTNLTICSMARAMLIDADLRDYFWPFAVLAATHIKQRVPHASLPPNTTPFELWFKHKPDLSHLRPFGTKCTVRVLTNRATKFEPRGETGCFLGYASDAKGYLIWVSNPTNNGGTLKTRRDVIFHDLPIPIPSPNVPPDYRPLWENVEFPDHLQSNQDNVTEQRRVSTDTELCGRSISSNDPTFVTPYVPDWNISSHDLNHCTHSHVLTDAGAPGHSISTNDPIQITPYMFVKRL